MSKTRLCKDRDDHVSLLVHVTFILKRFAYPPTRRWGALGTAAFLLLILLGFQGGPGTVLKFFKSGKRLVKSFGLNSELSLHAVHALYC